MRESGSESLRVSAPDFRNRCMNKSTLRLYEALSLRALQGDSVCGMARLPASGSRVAVDGVMSAARQTFREPLLFLLLRTSVPPAKRVV